MLKQPQNQSRKYEPLFSDIDEGRIKIPRFQRDFVWTTAQTASLIDSVVKGYPIGTFIFWRTREEMRSIKDIGNIKLPDTPSGDVTLYVLDGQQRITSLYAVRKGVRVTKEGKELDYKRISINLDCDPAGDDQIVTAGPPEGARYISVYELLNGTLAELTTKYQKDSLDKIDIYRGLLRGYDFSTIVIEDYRIDIACDIFTRINTGGTKLTIFEIMMAKTYDQTRDFDLAREFESLVNDDKGKDLEDAGFQTIPESTVLQCIAAHLSQRVSSRDILKLNKSDFIDGWPIMKKGLFAAVDYVRTHLRIPVSLLLPYYALMVPLTYFFIRNGFEAPSPRQNQLLTQYFWWASLSNRFTEGAESKMEQDLKRMDDILNRDRPSYPFDDIHLTLDFLKAYSFSAGDAFCKAILCLYAYFEPKSFASNSLVNLDNSWLSRANSKNFHHFFPKGYLTKSGVTEAEANSILNITLVDDYLNKNKIRAKAPSVYMQEFKAGNRGLAQTMRTHLIDDLDAYGVWSDDYATFLDQRGRRVLEEINKRLNPDAEASSAFIQDLSTQEPVVETSAPEPIVPIKKTIQNRSRQSISSGTPKKTSAGRKLSPKAKGWLRTAEFLGELQSQGINLVSVEGRVYKAAQGKIIGIASATEQTIRPQNWFLGLPEREYDAIVLLCEKADKAVLRFIFPKDFLQNYQGNFSKSSGELKIKIFGESETYYIRIPSVSPKRINQFLNNLAPLKSTPR